MKMQKADPEEIEAVLKFAQELESEIKYEQWTDEELGKWVRKAPPLMRIIFGYTTLLDNCCDPDKDYLDWKPEILVAIEASKEIGGTK